MLLNCGIGEDSWESLGLQGNQFSQSKRKSVLNIDRKDWWWSWSSNILATWCKELTQWKRPWCWEKLKAGGKGDGRRWSGWMASLTQWTWVWASSESWWWTGKPGMVRVRHDWVTELTDRVLDEGKKKKKLYFFARQRGTQWANALNTMSLCVLLMDILLIGWWWGQWKSTPSIFWFQLVCALCACEQHTVNFFHLVGVSVSAKELIDCYLYLLRGNQDPVPRLHCCLFWLFLPCLCILSFPN